MPNTEEISRMPIDESHIAKADPSKNFFINMLVRDIPLQRAIIDVIDNSIDAATITDSSRFDSYNIDITIDENKFVIVDNCGGMSRKIAQNYAFTFGRFPSQRTEPFAKIGNFGVGMKRTIFKIGRYFKFFSSYNDDSFFIEQDINLWIKEERNWQFEIKDGTAQQNGYPELPQNWHGVVIEISNLNENVRDDFKSAAYIKILSNEIEMFLAYFINRGLKITINRNELKPTNIEVFDESIFKPFKYCFPITPPDSADDGQVDVSIVIGLSARGKWDGGWYIFCNHRMIVKADQSEATGWGTDNVFGKKYHENYAYFRGIVYFESKNGDLLPWTTTKTGVNRDNDIYKQTLSKMASKTIPILIFLDNVAKQKSQYSYAKKQLDYDGKYDNYISYGEKLDEATQGEKMYHIDIDSYSTEIILPKLDQPIVSSRANVSIQYSVDRKLATKVKEHIEGSSYSDAGYLTFMQYIENNNLNQDSEDE